MTADIIHWPRHVAQRCDLPHEDGGWNCPICAGGLFQCAVCGAAEGEVPTDCPGYRLHPDERAAVYNGHLDWVRGKGWINQSAWRRG